MPVVAGYDVAYSNSAFKAGNSYEAPYEPSKWQIYCAFDRALATISATGDSRWMVFRKWHLHIFEVNLDAIDNTLTFVIPAGSKQQTHLSLAIACFDEAMAEQLGAPVDTTLRNIEEHSLACMKCNSTPDWVRYTDRRGNDFFCDSHARGEFNFGSSDPPDRIWTQIVLTPT